MSDDFDTWYALIEKRRVVERSLVEIDKQIAALNRPRHGVDGYDIAIRPDDRNADSMLYHTVLDDIVVMRPSMFRAEQMTTNNWWVACYLNDDTHDRICWSVTAHARPKRIEWVTTEFPEAAVYEHDIKKASA